MGLGGQGRVTSCFAFFFHFVFSLTKCSFFLFSCISFTNVSLHQHFQSQQLVDHLDIQRRQAPLPWTDQIFTPIKNSRRRTWHFCPNPSQHSCTFERKTHKLLDPIWESENQDFSWNITDKFNSLTFYTEITQRALFTFIRRSSLVLVVVPFSWMSSLALAFTFACGLAVTLPFL